MAGNSAEMKVKATMDNSDLKKKSKESKDALRDFAKVGEDAVSSLGSAFGINTGKIDQMMSAVRGLGENLSKSGNTGTAALGNLLKSVNGLSAGIAGIGIGAIVAGFKALKDEAENFKNTVAGANIELQTTAYIDTYKQVIHDYNSEIGESFANLESKWKKFWGTMGSNIKAAISTGAIFAGAMPTEQGMQAIESYNKLTADATANAEKASQLKGEILNLEYELAKESVKWEETDARIAELRRKAADATLDTVERQKALALAQQLTVERYDAEAKIRKDIADKTVQYNSLANSSKEAEIAGLKLQNQVAKVIKEKADKVREMLGTQTALTKQAEAEAKAIKDAADAREAMAKARADLKAWDGSVSGNLTLPTQAVSQQDAPGIAVPITPVVDEEEWTVTAEQLNSLLSGTIDSISQSLGGLVGDLINGENAWENFGHGALSAVGDLAVSFGRICLGVGLASEAIKDSLALNPGAALVAGVALIALGTAVKTSLSNLSSGNYSAAGSVATSTGSYGGSSSSIGTSFDTQDITVNVKGSLRADGNQLLAVIENENTRKNRTT